MVPPCHIRVPDPEPAYAYLSEGSSMPQLGRRRSCPADVVYIADPLSERSNDPASARVCVGGNELECDWTFCVVAHYLTGLI